MTTPEPSTTKIPSLEVPADVNDTAKGHFENLKRNVPAIHAELDGAKKLLAGVCAIEDAACDGTWNQIATHLAKAKDMGYDLGARCRGTSEDAKRFQKRLAEHRKVIKERTAAIQAQIDGLLSSDDEKAKWQAHQAKATVPRPCLKFACKDW